ncbi:sensor histidine kinase [Conexibacter stalactiti]|uniref:histidine kinase n=1 Tax=Conexibacter stalactiti TaxID=1940611 RepID=A0ABU4HYL8_9ACTN|nr:sensor histidine kinase [Conexibacter stalactiti]MDW5598403.1 sensor histidine kinase [Conexibacter stalactiti]MEC5039045.1 sensor histidine kinase [Conexibacter stalactiti]
MSAVATTPAQDHAPYSRRQALTLAVGQVAAGALIAGLVELALFYSGNDDPPAWPAVLYVAGAWIYVAAGTVAWLRRPGSRIGLLMTIGGFAWLGAGLINTSVPALVAAGSIVQTVPIAILVHLLLAFPSGRLRGTAERVTVAGIYGVSLVLQAPRYLLAPGPLQIDEDPQLLDVAAWTQRGVATAFVLVACALLLRRLRDAPPAQRRVLGPLSLYGAVAALAMPLGAGIVDLLDGRGAILLSCVQMGLTAGVTVFFAIAVSRGGFARTGQIEELGARLGGEEGRREGLAEVLGETLGDSSLELLFRVPGEQSWVNGAGVATVPPAASTRRGVAKVQLGDETIGAIVYDATLLTRSDEVREAAQIVALALDRERLTVELRASRARLVEAGDEERRRIARDLHDGLQSRLVLLAVQAGVAPGTSSELREGIEVAIDELRALVHGVMPAELTERGLPAAVNELADRMPIDVVLEVAGFERRPSPAVESTAFFVTAEAMVNAVKHARADELTVTLAHGERALRIEVRDDGTGGAGARSGNGIRSIADRVEALGGRLRIDSATGAGTRVMVELPCAS